MYKRKVVDAFRVNVSIFSSGTGNSTPLAFDLFATKIYESENRKLNWVNMQPNKLRKGKKKNV
jgi:hypothetical protein